jgi:hypothetical protein
LLGDDEHLETCLKALKCELDTIALCTALAPKDITTQVSLGNIGIGNQSILTQPMHPMALAKKTSKLSIKINPRIVHSCTSKKGNPKILLPNLA